MTIKLSTGLRDRLAGAAVSRSDTVSTIAFVSGTKRITDSTSELLDDGFRPGDIITITGTASNNGYFQIASMAADGSLMTVIETLVDEAAGITTVIAARGKNLKETFHGSVLRIFSGSAPADADAAEAGTLLLTVTVSKGAFTIGSLANALLFGDILGGKLSMSGSQVWEGLGLSEGVAGYYRLYDNALMTGSSTKAIRIQGTIATSGADMNAATRTIVVDGNSIIKQFDLTLAA